MNALVNDWLLGTKSSSPGMPPHIARYWTNAFTGLAAWVVLPIHIITPVLNWSFLE